MLFRTLLQAWLQNTAKAKLRETVIKAAQEQVAAAAPIDDRPRHCHLGIVFALSIESGCFEDLLQGMIAIRGGPFVLREGGLNGRGVVIVLSGPGRANASRAANILIDGHRPDRVVSAGFSGALSADLRRSDILVADRLRSVEGDELEVAIPTGLAAMLRRPAVYRGALLTVDRVVRLPRERESLFRKYGAQAVDMESFAVAEACRRRGVPFSAVRVISDTADEVLPADVEYLMSQKTVAGQMGAAFGAILNRPSSAKDLYRLRENALVASLRLAKFLADVRFDDVAETHPAG